MKKSITTFVMAIVVVAQDGVHSTFVGLPFMHSTTAKNRYTMRNRHVRWKSMLMADTNNIVQVNESKKYMTIKDVIPLLQTCRSVKDIYQLYNTNFDKSNPNIATITLKRIAQLLHHSKYDDTTTMSVLLEITNELLKPIIESLIVTYNDSTLTIQSTAESLITLSKLLQNIYYNNNNNNNEELFETFAPIQLLLWGRLEDTITIESNDDNNNNNNNEITASTALKISPQKLVDCLLAVKPLIMKSNDDNNNIRNSILYNAICQRLYQGDALGRLESYQLLALFRALHYNNNNNNNNENNNNKQLYYYSIEQKKLLQSITRRFRKQAVRDKSTKFILIQTLEWTCRIYLSLQNNQSSSSSHNNDNKNDDIEGTSIDLCHELQLMVYTISKHLISPPLNVTTTIGESFTTTLETDKTNTNDIDNNDNNSDILSMSDLTTICRTMQTVLTVKSNDLMVKNLLYSMIQSLSLEQYCTTKISDIAYILVALQQWQVYDRPILVKKLGEQFYKYVNRNVNENSFLKILPRNVNTILRCSAFLIQSDHNKLTIMKPYLDAARILFINKTFLNRCNAIELSNFAWFCGFKSNNYYSNDVLIALAKRILEPDIVETCTPKLACRILNSFSTIWSKQLNEYQNNVDIIIPSNNNTGLVLRDLFASFNEYLLTTDLSPLDVSSAMCAFARAENTFDLGVFDHLAQVVASQTSECSTRQLSQCLWACGKMMKIDEGGEDLDSEIPVEPDIPPYVMYASILAKTLSMQSEQTSSKDIAQALWGMAKVQIYDSEIVDPLLKRAGELSSEFNARETANILWATSKFKSSNNNYYKLVYALTRKFTDGNIDIIKDSIKPLEASSILYALAKMNIREEDVFRNLTRIILMNINSVTAHIVAVVSWAHREVHIEPPQELLNLWATQKLGLVAVTMKDPQPNVPYY